jgi:uncharacterized protein with ParB-like and HNH nuclease domain
MHAQEKQFLHFLEGVDKKFVIPVYQRNYDWRIEHCEQLFNDLLDIKKYNFRNHFLGSIVYVYDDSRPGMEFLIIDGQQRIATISLLLLAIHNLIEKGEIEFKAELLKEQIKELYLIDKYSKGEKRIKLKPIKDDNEAFVELFNNNPEEYISKSNITTNYKYFLNKIKESKILADDLFEAIKKLMIVDIKLNNSDDDPQLIFESLNSTGLSLSQADLVRNFILMGKPLDIQEEYYKLYWNPIEKNTQYKVDSFIRDYLTLKERIIPNKDKIYISFKKYVQKNYPNGDIENLLKELLKFSKYYKRIAFSQDNDLKVNKILKRINNLDVTVSYPFLLEIFDYYEDKVISNGNLINILYIIETYAFRRLICNVPTNALNKVFATLGREIKKHADFKENYFEIFKYILINKKYSQRFPTDDEFSEMLKSRDIYNLKSKNKLHLLERLENYDNVEKVSVEELLNEGKINIEHIMPQTLSVKWKGSLGENWEEVHNKYLNTLGNITLTGYNSKMSNRPFIEKRDIEKGFKDSKLSLNKFLRNLDYWDENTINKRANKLKGVALKIWLYPTTEYESRILEAYRYNLSEDYNFTGEKIKSFILINQEYPVKSWKDFYQTLAINLYDLAPDIFNSFLGDGDFTDGRKMISVKMKDLRNPLKVTDNIYLESNLSAESIVNMTRLMLRKYDIEEDEVVVILTEKEEILSETQKKRIDFWKGLLEINKNKTKYFANSKAKKYYDIHCSSGVAGIGYYYTIKQESVSIGLSISRDTKEKNDNIFHKLLENKKEIEKTFGEDLFWFNDKNIKVSAIYKQYNYAGLKNEDKWKELQNDMVNDMIKLTDIFDEYIKEFD